MLLRLIILIALIYIGVRVVKSMTEPKGPAGPPPEPTRKPSKPAHEILGVEPGASTEEVRAAYQKLVQQYHPDRVADMGPEVREVAEARTKEINAAYAALKRD